MYFRQKKYFTVLTEEQFANRDRKGQLIDVREPDEFKSGRIIGARNIPSTQMKAYLNSIPKGSPLYLYCQTQVRSQRAAVMLSKAGFEKVYILQGGFKNWRGKIKN